MRNELDERDWPSKARTLEALRGKLRTARILPLEVFTVQQWAANRQGCLAALRSRLGVGPLIIRSSKRSEDRGPASLAGHFLSVKGAQTEKQRAAAVDRVIASYGPGANDEEILAQPALSQARICGVAFSRDPATGSAYRVINLATHPDTSSVTSGGMVPTSVSVVVKGGQAHSKQTGRILALIEELESLLPKCALDLEFAFDHEDSLYLFQVRPLAICPPALAAQDHRKVLQDLAERVGRRLQPNPPVLGNTTILGVMPDWNPAELLGTRPRPLAASLYRYTLTDTAWAEARHRQGYRDMRGKALVVLLGGQPFVDVRLSFNSLIPAPLDARLAERLVEHYLEQLRSHPEWHDKIEFEIVLTACTFDRELRLRELRQAGFTHGDIVALRDSLRTLTQRMIDGSWHEDRSRIGMLDRRWQALSESTQEPMRRFLLLLEDARDYGAVAFAGLARVAFVAVQMLRSLVTVGELSACEIERFMLTLNTIGSRLGRDFSQMERTEFLKHYGHLRPGTFEIGAARYDESPEVYFNWARRKAVESPIHHFELSAGRYSAVTKLLQGLGLHADGKAFFAFVREAIEWREYAKFLFSRNLSDALAALGRWGAQRERSKDELSFLSLAGIRRCVTGPGRAAEILEEEIAKGAAAHQVTRSLWLPPLIRAPEELGAFNLPEATPNFVTQGRVVGPVVRAEERSRLGGGVVFLERADPGYEWIFSHGIGGLVTAYGGVNSHMAIRAGELGVPAVLGAGPRLFEYWASARGILLDCGGRRVELIA